jgi:uncharacterized protein YukE
MGNMAKNKVSANIKILENELVNMNDSKESVQQSYNVYLDINDTLMSSWEGDLKEIYEAYMESVGNSYASAIHMMEEYYNMVESFDKQMKEINENAETAAEIGGK